MRHLAAWSSRVGACLFAGLRGSVASCVAALCLALPLSGAFVAPAQADSLEALETYLRTVRSGRAEFTQSVTTPARDGQPSRVRQSSGRFEFQRPDRFRFAYQKPFVQTLVADGRTLWLHDPDLNQVTARPQAQALASTPVALIASAPDLSALRQAFDLSAQLEREGLQWVLATPRTRDSALREIRVGLRGTELAALDILDGLGQRSVIRFTRLETNVSLPVNTFEFRPPPGADVIRP